MVSAPDLQDSFRYFWSPENQAARGNSVDLQLTEGEAGRAAGGAPRRAGVPEFGPNGNCVHALRVSDLSGQRSVYFQRVSSSHGASRSSVPPLQDSLQDSQVFGGSSAGSRMKAGSGSER